MQAHQAPGTTTLDVNAASLNSPSRARAKHGLREVLQAVAWSCALSCSTTPQKPPSTSPPLAIVEGDASIVAGNDRLPRAMAALTARGLRLIDRPRILVHSDVASFRAASGQLDPSLRAWSTWNTVHLMPLSTWARQDDEGVRQRLTHELCHLAIYQRFGTELRARAAGIPRYFAEGVCSVVAGQQRPDLATLVPAAPPDPLDTRAFAADPKSAYAAAHHAIVFLDHQLGPDWLNTVLDQAAADGSAGAVERALVATTGYDRASLWQAVLADEATTTPSQLR